MRFELQIGQRYNRAVDVRFEILLSRFQIEHFLRDLEHPLGQHLQLAVQPHFALLLVQVQLVHLVGLLFGGVLRVENLALLIDQLPSTHVDVLEKLPTFG